MNDNLIAVRGALNLLGKTSTAKVASNAVPTARTRAALDLLAGTTAEALFAQQVNLRELTENLFNWTGTPKANKNLMRALSTALTTPDRYPHAVELTAYLVALTPLLEPDRLVRLYALVNQVDTAYAPARYTLQLSARLRAIFERYPEERREKLAASLWLEAHSGRWWDLTAGQPQPEAAAPDGEPTPVADLLASFDEFKLTWTPQTAAVFANLPASDTIRDTLTRYNTALLKEKVVDPDTAILASHLPWLAPLERPESPVGSLLETINDIITAVKYDLPEKPKTFSGLFPNIRLYGGAEFPFPTSILATDGRQLTPGVTMQVVRNATILADNRTYMGNCTWGYKSQMEKGSYVLYRLHHGEEIYNGSLNLDNNHRWRLGELNSRFNRGNVPAQVRAAFMDFIGRLPAPVADNEYLRAQEHNKKVETFRKGKYRFKL